MGRFASRAKTSPSVETASELLGLDSLAPFEDRSHGVSTDHPPTLSDLAERVERLERDNAQLRSVLVAVGSLMGARDILVACDSERAPS